MRQSEDIILQFPPKGIDTKNPRTQQPEGTSVDLLNVRVRDSLEGRQRGGIRPGLSKYLNAQLSAGNKIQDINFATVIANSAPSASSLSYRQIENVAVSDGTVAKFNTTAFTNASVVGNATLSNTAPFIMSGELFGRLYYTDGTNYATWVGSNNSLIEWTPTDGSLPGTDGVRTPRLLEIWRGRVVLSGLPSDPHNWFMSALGDPLDWDYSPATITEASAIQGAIGTVGKIADVVNCLLPYSEDVLIMGCDHSTWQILGDPQAGGRVDLISSTVGMAFGRPYCMDPQGNIYFFSSRGRIYRMAGGGSNPEVISEPVEELLESVDLNTTFVRMAWNEQQDGFHVYLMPFSNTSQTSYFWDSRTQGWFKDQFASNTHGPTAVKVIDGDDPNDRVLLVGGWDSRIRKLDESVAQDDGTSFDSYVIIGPTMGQQGMKPIILTELQALTDDDGQTIKYEILAGDTPEKALDEATAGFTGDGTWEPGMGPTRNPRERGYYIYYKIGTTAATGRWSLERVRSKIQIVKTGRGRTRIIDNIAYSDPADLPGGFPSMLGVGTSKLHLSYYADSSNMTINGSNKITNWRPSELGSRATSNTSTPFINTFASIPYVASNTVFNSKPVATLSDGDALGVINLTEDNTTIGGWPTGEMDIDNGIIACVVSFSGNSTVTFLSLRDADNLGTSLSFALEANTALSFSKAVSGTVTEYSATGLFAPNTAYILTLSYTGSRWIARQNGTEIINAVPSAYAAFDDLDTGGGINVTCVSGKEFQLGHISWFAPYDATSVASIESKLASYFGITLA